MKLSSIMAGAFVTGFSGAAMPGPVLVATIVLTPGLGFWAGPAVVTGHFLIEGALVLALHAGLGRHLSRPDAPLVRAIGLVGGLVLILMALQMLASLPTLTLHGLQPGAVRQHPIQAGLVLSAASPYFWVWWASIGLGLMGEAVAHRGRAGLAAFYSGHILSDYTWYGLVSGLIAGGGRLLSDPVYRTMIGLCALLLIFFGARFVVVSLRPVKSGEQPT
ncbi:MAG: LysE family transporter [Armatimonadetes bacterium]|nr:LysE family transporter [Armatimonadota bacterium]